MLSRWVGLLCFRRQAYAQTAGVKSYNIPAGRLANVLNQFAEQSGTSIAMDAQPKAYIA